MADLNALLFALLIRFARLLDFALFNGRCRDSLVFLFDTAAPLPNHAFKLGFWNCRQLLSGAGQFMVNANISESGLRGHWFHSGTGGISSTSTFVQPHGLFLVPYHLAQPALGPHANFGAVDLLGRSLDYTAFGICRTLIPSVTTGETSQLGWSFYKVSDDRELVDEREPFGEGSSCYAGPCSPLANMLRPPASDEGSQAGL